MTDPDNNFGTSPEDYLNEFAVRNSQQNALNILQTEKYQVQQNDENKDTINIVIES